jgi:hypothetical protein
MKVAQLTVDDLRVVVAGAVEAKLRELLGDPDEGRDLKPSAVRRLRASLRRTRRGERGMPARRLAKKLGLRW